VNDRPAKVKADVGINIEINTSQPHPARIYDYYLGGKDNFPADRVVAEQILAIAPESRVNAQANRAFLRRAVRFLAREAGIRQFLDIGAGLPTEGNVHEVAHAVAPAARVVYVDNDPIVLTHARALLAADNATIVQGDLRDPGGILEHPVVREALSFDQPVGLLLVAILHLIGDEDDPAGIVAQLRDALPPGSYVVLSHATADFDPERAVEAIKVYKAGTVTLVPRSRAQIERYFAGFELVDPGLVPLPQWRPDTATAPPTHQVPIYGGVGTLPA